MPELLRLIDAVTAGTNVLIATVDREFRYTFFNSAHHNELRRLTGKETQLGMSLLDLLADMPEERAKALATWGRALQGETIIQKIEFGDSGHYRRWYHARHTPVFDDAGAVVGAGEVTSDITDMVLAENALRASEEKYHFLFDSIPDAVFATDLDYTVVSWNAAAERMYGWAATEAIGRRAGTLLRPEYLARPREQVIQTLLEQGEWRDEVINHRRDGTAFAVLASARQIRDAAGNAFGYVAINRDISDYKRAEQWLGFTTEVLARVIDGVIVLSAATGRIVYTNSAFDDMFGYAHAELLGQDLGVLLAPDAASPETLTKVIVPTLREFGRWHGDLSGRRKNGGAIWTNCTISTLDKSPWGKVWLLIQRDITGRKRVEETRVATLERNRDMLVREVHHRIKNHLQGVLGLMHMQLGKHPDLATSLAEVITQIKAIAEVYGLQSRSGGLGIDLGGIIAMIVKGATGPVPVIYRKPDGAPVLLANADSVPVALIVNELLINALKHLSAPDPARPIDVSLEASATCVQVRITSGQARLPPGFDFALRQGLGCGLDLVATLLPRQGAELQLTQTGDEVCAELLLRNPVLLSA
jgi:PAS domain S-box-containing protein